MVNASDSSNINSFTDKIAFIYYIFIMKDVRILNGYRVLYKPDYHNTMKSKNWNGYVYEHIYLMETELGRLLNKDECVHHLDCDRSNNRLSNLIVMLKSQHSKLHKWIDRGAPISKEIGEQGMNSGKPKICVICGSTLQAKQTKTCSMECCAKYVTSKSPIPSKEELIELRVTMSREAVGRHFNVSGNAVKKWEKKYEMITY